MLPRERTVYLLVTPKERQLLFQRQPQLSISIYWLKCNMCSFITNSRRMVPIYQAKSRLTFQWGTRAILCQAHSWEFEKREGGKAFQLMCISAMVINLMHCYDSPVALVKNFFREKEHVHILSLSLISSHIKSQTNQLSDGRTGLSSKGRV